MSSCPCGCGASRWAALPTTITLASLVTGLVGVAWWPSPWGFGLVAWSIALDCFDGWIARRLRATTAWGAELDYASDVAVTYAVLWRAFVAPAPWLFAAAAGLGLIQAWGRWRSGARVSGRTAIVLVAFAVWAGRSWWLR